MWFLLETTWNYLRPCMYKRHKAGMYKRHNPGMHKRQFARCKWVVRMTGLRPVPGVLYVVPVFHPVVVVQIPEARKSEAWGHACKPHLAGGHLPPKTCPVPPFQHWDTWEASVQGALTMITLATTKYCMALTCIDHDHTASLQMNSLSRNQRLTMMEAFLYVSVLL